jgi:hypothetical protein
MVNTYGKKRSTTLTIKKIQITDTLRLYLTPVRMAVIKKTNSNKAGEDEGEKGPYPLLIVI